jgi:hypothetical protein
VSACATPLIRRLTWGIAERPVGRGPGPAEIDSSGGVCATSTTGEVVTVGRTGGASFAEVTHGYDPAHVDERVAAFQAALAQVQALVDEREHRVGRLVDELAQASRVLLEVEPPAYSGSGARVDHVVRMAQEQARDELAVATNEADQTLAAARASAAQTLTLARQESAAQVQVARRASLDLRTLALTQAAQVIAAATRAAPAITAAAQRDAAERRSVAEREAQARRGVTDEDVARLHAVAEREAAALRAAVEQEAAELREASRKDASALLAAASREQAQTRREAEQLTDGLDIRFAARRAEAQWLDTARHQRAFGVIATLLAEAEARASDAERRAATATARADLILRDGEQHTKLVLDQAQREADQIAAQAQTQAKKVIAAADAEATRLRREAQREVAELTGRRDHVADHVHEVRVLLERTPVDDLVDLAAQPTDPT